MSGYDITDEALDAADRIYGGQIPFSGLRQILDAALPFILPDAIAEAEKRGALKALARVSEEIDEDKRYPGFDLVMWLTGLQNGIESGDVTL